MENLSGGWQMLSIRRNKSIVFNNWSSSVHCEPSQFERPRDIGELITIVDRCHAEGRRLRVVGAGHSFTPLVATTDVLVSIDHLSGIESIDAKNLIVTVGARTRLKELCDELFNDGEAMENLGEINVQAGAGAESTGTHGTAIDFGSVSKQIQVVTSL